MKTDTKQHIVDIGPDFLVRNINRASIGQDFILKDNLDIDIDFDDPQFAPVSNLSTKVVGHSSIFVCVDGEIDLTCNSVPCKMRKGDVSYAQTGHIGSVQRFSPDARFVLIACADNFYMPPLTAGEAAALRRELVTRPIAHLEPEQLHGVSIQYKMMSNALAKRDRITHVRGIVQGLYQAIFYLVFSAYDSQSKADSPLTNVRQEEVFQKFIRLVEKYYSQERNIGFYADKLCITPKYLSQLIYKASGIYAGNHIDNYVIAEAKVLIKSHKYSIAQVSDMLSFTSQAYFGRYFKKHTGYTPLEFAEKK